jgi:hypothetical protein
MGGGASFKAGAIPISELGEYGFWSREPIGATAEDYAAAERGEMSPERQEQLTCACVAARDALFEMEVPGVRFWMSERRRAN